MKQQKDIYGIQHACYTKNNKAGEQFIKDHGVSFIISGEMEAYDGVTKHLYRKGDVLFYRKNVLIKFVKYPDQEHGFEAISVVLDELLLKEFTDKYTIFSSQAPKESLLKLHKDDLLTAYFKSLEPWFNSNISKELVETKKIEMIQLLLRYDNNLKDILFHFDIPGKINLEAFMNSNFRFNVPLVQLAFLTGRSLATFKRDFEKIFNTSPNKWIQQKRLQEAYFLLEHKKMKTKDVYLEVGFETLSHFSYAFKNHFGVNPSQV